MRISDIMQGTIAEDPHRCVAALVEKADAANKPGEGENCDDAHAKHEFERLPFHVGNGTTANGTLPCCCLSARMILKY